jgi:Spy/CpxP family protein refolding chaperone
MRRLRLVALMAALPFLASVAEAQRAPGARGAPARREQMEQQLRRNLWRIAKERVGFTDAQMRKLEQTSVRFDDRRRALFSEERAQRVALRRELLADAKADQARVATALDRLHQLQRARVDLLIEEQREFATFMTPVQRAKYAALQEQVRRRVDSLRRQRPDSGLARRH